MTMAITVLIVGGGTGGHILPGIALYEEFRESGVRTYFLMGRRDIRFSSAQDIQRDHLFLYPAPSLTKNLLRFPVFALNFIMALIRAVRLVRKLRVDVVIGMGGYVSAPALIAAIMRKIPFYLCEQNSIPGRVTKFFSKRAQTIFATFDATREFLNNGVKTVTAGNPIRKKVFTGMNRREAKERFNLRHCGKVILVIGGSQGAVSLNDLILGIKKKYPEEFSNIGLIWSTGAHSYQEYREQIYTDIKKGSVFLSSYIEDVGVAYRASDVAISRAGAGVMMELAAMGVPQILIPYPYAALNHQDRNADEFVNAGVAIKFSSEEATPERVGPELFRLLGSRTRLDRMAKNAFSISRKDASAVIVKKILGDQGVT